MSQTPNPADAIVAHHAEMLCELQARTDALIGAVGLGEPSGPPSTALRDYIESTIIPHALAEEQTVYPAARTRERRLVDSLLLEHDALRRLAGELATAGGDVERVAAASAFVELFGLHAAKENEFVLPAILEDPAADLGALLGAMHTSLEAGEATVTEELDVRALPHGHRHDEIFTRLQKLDSGEALVIVNDHDPRPLRYQLDALWPAAFAWRYREEGPAQWKVEVARR